MGRGGRRGTASTSACRHSTSGQHTHSAQRTGSHSDMSRASNNNNEKKTKDNGEDDADEGRGGWEAKLRREVEGKRGQYVDEYTTVNLLTHSRPYPVQHQRRMKLSVNRELCRGGEHHTDEYTEGQCLCGYVCTVRLCPCKSSLGVGMGSHMKTARVRVGGSTALRRRQAKRRTAQKKGERIAVQL